MTDTSLDIFMVLILVHLLSDFLFQSDKTASMRNCGEWNKMVYGNVGHALMHFTISIIAFSTVYIFNNKYIWVNAFTICSLVFLTFIHFLIDMLKSVLIFYRPFEKYSIGLFLGDQAIHLVSIIWISCSIHRQMVAFPKIINILKSQITLNVEQKIILTLILIIAGLWGVGIFIKIMFKYKDKLQYKNIINNKIFISEITTDNTSGASPDIGFWVGILERLFIILVLTVGANEQIIGFVLTAKSVARFKEFDNKDFVASYILGTFFSIITAIIIGVIIKKLEIIPTLFNKN